jgi:hypothetical protein
VKEKHLEERDFGQEFRNVDAELDISRLVRCKKKEK